MVWKLDISNLIKFLWLRDDSHAKWEIQQYAKLVSLAVEENFPLVFDAYNEARKSETFSMAEMNALITGVYSNLSESQCVRIQDLRNSII